MKVTVYSEPGCVQCVATIRTLTKQPMPHETGDLSTEDKAMAMVRGLLPAHAAHRAGVSTRIPQLVSSFSEVNALPEATFFRCSCGQYGYKASSALFSLGGRNRVPPAEVAEDHLPLEVLWRPDQGRDEVRRRLLAMAVAQDREIARVRRLLVEHEAASTR